MLDDEMDCRPFALRDNCELAFADSDLNVAERRSGIQRELHEVVLVGVGDMVEIWTPENWEARQVDLDCDTIADTMDELIV